MSDSKLYSTLRRLFSQKLYAAINIGGLAIGLAAAILILLYVTFELSYDRFLPNAERLYKIETTLNLPGRDPITTRGSQGPILELLMAEEPGIEAGIRLVVSSANVFQDDQRFEESLVLADPGLFDVLGLKMVSGDGAGALDAPSSIVLSETLAQKFFGRTDIVGETLSLTLRTRKDYQVSAVMQDIPQNSHLGFEMAIRYNRDDFGTGTDFTDPFSAWNSLAVLTYVLLSEDANPDLVQGALPGFIDRNLPSQSIDGLNMAPHELFEYELVAISDIHLHGAGAGMRPGGDITTVMTFAGIAALIVLIAAINYTNLATARASLREREIALRKTLGAGRAEIARQFIGEALVTTALAFALALALAALLRPWFAGLLDRSIGDLTSLGSSEILGFIILYLLVTLLAGGYPAALASRLKPGLVLGSARGQRDATGPLRSALIVVQFAISVLLMIGASVIYAQTRFATEIEPGFEKEGLIAIRGPSGEGAGILLATLAERFRGLRDIVSVTRSGNVPGDGEGPSTGISLPDLAEPLLIGVRYVDFEFFETYGVKPVAGRLFERRFGQDNSGDWGRGIVPAGTVNSVVINASGARRLGYDSPEAALDATFSVGPGEDLRDFRIVGVVPDMQFDSARRAKRSEYFIVLPAQTNIVTLRHNGSDLTGLLVDMEKMWADLFPDRAFRFELISENLAELYEGDERNGMVLAIFSGLAIMVSCLGLFGLAAFSVARRKREIGIRKVLGASVPAIVRLLVWQFSKPVILATFIAWPLAWLLADDWLASFAYRISLTPELFIGAGLAALAVAWLTVGGHALRAARTSPAVVLHYE